MHLPLNFSAAGLPQPHYPTWENWKDLGTSEEAASSFRRSLSILLKAVRADSSISHTRPPRFGVTNPLRSTSYDHILQPEGDPDSLGYTRRSIFQILMVSLGILELHTELPICATSSRQLLMLRFPTAEVSSAAGVPRLPYQLP